MVAGLNDSFITSYLIFLSLRLCIWWSQLNAKLRFSKWRKGIDESPYRANNVNKPCFMDIGIIECNTIDNFQIWMLYSYWAGILQLSTLLLLRISVLIAAWSRWRSWLERSPRKRKVGCSNLSHDRLKS